MLSLHHGFDLFQLVGVVIVPGIELVNLLDLVCEATRICISKPRRVKVFLFLDILKVLIGLGSSSSFFARSQGFNNFWLGHIILSELKRFFSSCELAYRSLFHLLRQGIRLSLKSDLLRILSLRLLLLLGLLPGLAANVCTETAQSRVLGLVLHLLVLLHLVRAELTRVRTVSPGVLLRRGNLSLHL